MGSSVALGGSFLYVIRRWPRVCEDGCGCGCVERFTGTREAVVVTCLTFLWHFFSETVNLEIPWQILLTWLWARARRLWSLWAIAFVNAHVLRHCYFPLIKTHCFLTYARTHMQPRTTLVCCGHAFCANLFVLFFASEYIGFYVNTNAHATSHDIVMVCVDEHALWTCILSSLSTCRIWREHACNLAWHGYVLCKRTCFVKVLVVPRICSPSQYALFFTSTRTHMQPRITLLRCGHACFVSSFLFVCHPRPIGFYVSTNIHATSHDIVMFLWPSVLCDMYLILKEH